MSFFRRPVRVFALFCGLLALFLFLGPSWELPESWKDTGVLTSSRAKLAQVLGTKKKQVQVDEIYGLLHLVTADSEEYQHVLSDNAELDPTKPISLDVYAAGEKGLDWEAEMERLNAKHPITVFSKTYCPYSKKAKNLLNSYDLKPPAKIIEVDLRDDSNILKALLTRLTHHSTFPNILVRGKSLGGSDSLQELHASNALANILEEAGVLVQSKSS